MRVRTDIHIDPHSPLSPTPTPTHSLFPVRFGHYTARQMHRVSPAAFTSVPPSVGLSPSPNPSRPSRAPLTGAAKATLLLQVARAPGAGAREGAHTRTEYCPPASSSDTCPTVRRPSLRRPIRVLASPTPRHRPSHHRSRRCVKGRPAQASADQRPAVSVSQRAPRCRHGRCARRGSKVCRGARRIPFFRGQGTFAHACGRRPPSPPCRSGAGGRRTRPPRRAARRRSAGYAPAEGPETQRVTEIQGLQFVIMMHLGCARAYTSSP